MRPDLADSAFLRACRREPVPYTPVWFMRQAGRSLSEYRAVRAGVGMLESCLRADLVTEITLQPVRRYGVDAAILFSDIVLPLRAIGVGLDIRPGVGPVVDQPFRSAGDLARLRPLEPAEDLAPVLEAIRELTGELQVPLIGFAGAPFTLASYLVEGGPSKTHALTKALMYAEPELWRALLDRLTDLSVTTLRAQVDAGAAAVQVFDSWAGALSLADYRRYVLPASTRVFAGLADLGVPRIHFGVGTAELLGAMAEAGADVVGIDFHLPLDEGARRVGPDRAVQGNLDPAVCLAPWPVVADRTREVLRAADGLPGHVFNLGHGVLPETDPGILERVVDLVHRESAPVIGVLVMAYGTPRDRDDVAAYYTDVRRGRPPTPELLAELVARYDAIGGTFPMRAHTEAQCRGIAEALERLEPGGYLVRLGQKHARPTVEEGVAGLQAAGVHGVVGLVLAPHYSRTSVGQYAARAAAAGARLDPPLPVRTVESWHTLPAYLDFLATAVADSRRSLGDLGPAEVVFTAHALPVRALASGDPYSEQLRQTAEAVAARAALDRWSVAWQSAGRTPESWTGPDVLDVLRDRAAAGARAVVVCPCGFTADHLEVAYDLDIEATQLAEGLGLAFRRTASVNADPAVMGGLAEVVASATLELGEQA